MVNKKEVVKDLHWSLHPIVLNIELGVYIGFILLLLIASIMSGINGFVIFIGFLIGFITIYPLIKWEIKVIERNWDKIKTIGFVTPKAVWDDPLTKKVLKYFYFIYLPIFYFSFFLYIYLYGMLFPFFAFFGFIALTWAFLGITPIYINAKKKMKETVNA